MVVAAVVVSDEDEEGSDPSVEEEDEENKDEDIFGVFNKGCRPLFQGVNGGRIICLDAMRMAVPGDVVVVVSPAETDS